MESTHERAAMKRHGEYIELMTPHWEESYTMHFFRGHCEREEVNSAYDSYGDHVDLAEWKMRHAWARWFPVRGKDWDIELRECEQGRGAFPVTILEKP